MNGFWVRECYSSKVSMSERRRGGEHRGYEMRSFLITFGTAYIFMHAYHRGMDGPQMVGQEILLQ